MKISVSFKVNVYNAVTGEKLTIVGPFNKYQKPWGLCINNFADAPLFSSSFSSSYSSSRSSSSKALAPAKVEVDKKEHCMMYITVTRGYCRVYGKVNSDTVLQRDIGSLLHATVESQGNNNDENLPQEVSSRTPMLSAVSDKSQQSLQSKPVSRSAIPRQLQL